MPVDRLNEYRTWSTRQIRSLTGQLMPASIEELVASRRHWLLQSLDPIAYGVAAVGELVDLEVTSCIEAVSAALKDLRGQADVWSKWREHGIAGKPYAAVVLDTNVLLRHSENLIDIPWNVGLNIFPHEAIALGIPMVVVEELDRLKDSNGAMYLGDEKLAVRTLARKALRSLDTVFKAGYLNWQIRERGAGGMQLPDELHAILIVDDLHHTRTRDADLEIMDQAIRLRPFTSNVALATYDQAMIFRARSAGLKAFRPTEDS
ncbi:PIN domain-containing protein [Microbacterium sp. No. 7]|uniref:PIN domain-containing protein n=1 Tax=Microbacterium sp. No. 7 TaxID=1714373 RepID=UPI0006D26EA5|nr:PIN domain-containing protein [Microbacterium sp. No. 7]